MKSKKKRGKKGKKKPQHQRVPLPPQKLMMHIGNTQYDVVRFVGKKKYHMKLTRNDEDEWDLQWIDTNMTP